MITLLKEIGNDFIADTMDMSLVDKVIKITDDDAFGGSRELAKKEGIFAGSSSGGALAAAKKTYKIRCNRKYCSHTSR